MSFSEMFRPDPGGRLDLVGSTTRARRRTLQWSGPGLALLALGRSPAALASTSDHHHDRTKVERGLKVGQIGNAGVDLPPSFEQIGHPVLCLGDGR